MIFYIKPIYGETEYLKGNQIWLSGESPSIVIGTDLYGIPIGEGKVRYFTGMAETDIRDNYQFKSLAPEQKEHFIKAATPLIEMVLEAIPEAADATNIHFWNPSRTQLMLNSRTLERKYDTSVVEDAILYLNILGGGYPGISPTEELAHITGNRLYVTTEEAVAQKKSSEKFGNKRQAISRLDKLLEGSGVDSLVWLSYALHKKTRGFSFNTSKDTFEQIFMEFIEGEYHQKNKKQAAEEFFNMAEELANNPDSVIMQGVIYAAEYHGLIYKPKGAGTKYINTLTHNEVGSTFAQVLINLAKPQNNNEFKELFDEVKKTLNK